MLLVLPEGLTRMVDYSDRTAAVLWGDGARPVRLDGPLTARTLSLKLTARTLFRTPRAQVDARRPFQDAPT